MARAQCTIPAARVSREESGPMPLPDVVIGLTIGLIALSVVVLVWLNYIIWKRAQRNAFEPVPAA